MAMDENELQIRFNYRRAATEVDQNNHGFITEKCLDLALKINQLLPDSHEKDQAIDALDLVYMWSNAAIARRSSREESS